MTPNEIVERVTSWALLTRPEVGLWCETDGDWQHPSGRITALVIIGPDWQVMRLPLKITLVDLGRVLDVLDRCALWSPDALRTGIWVLAKLKRLLGFVGCTMTFSHLLQTVPPVLVVAEGAVDQYHAARLALLDAFQHAIITLEMGVIRAMTKSTVEGFLVKDGSVIYPEWVLVHPSGNPLPLAHHPPVNSWTKPQKATLVAPVGFRWMQVRYPLLEARVLAALADNGPAFRYFGEHVTMSEESERQIQHFMRKGVTMPPEEVDTFISGYHLLEIQYHLLTIVDTAEKTGIVTSYMNRRWRWQENPRVADDHERRRIATAYAGHSAATVLKTGLVKLMNHAEEQTRRMFLGFGQLLPHFDSLNYLIDERVPHERHCESLLAMMQLQIMTGKGDDQQLWTIHPEIAVGPTLTELVPWNDPMALAKIDLARDGAEQLTCTECGLTTMSQRVMDTHMLEDHSVGTV